MRKQILIALTAALLIAGVPAVATTGHLSQDSFVSTPSDVLSLTRTEQKRAWRDLHQQLRDQYGPPGFGTFVGWGVPPAVTIRSVTRKAARYVPALAPYDFAMVQGRLLIVNPRDMIVAEAIRGPRKASA